VSADIRCERDGAQWTMLSTSFCAIPGCAPCFAPACWPRPQGLVSWCGELPGPTGKRRSNPQEDALKRGEIPGGDSWGREEQDKWGTLSTRTETASPPARFPRSAADYRGFYENIRDTILGRAQLAVTSGPGNRRPAGDRTGSREQ